MFGKTYFDDVRVLNYVRDREAGQERWTALASSLMVQCSCGQGLLQSISHLSPAGALVPKT